MTRLSASEYWPFSTPGQTGIGAGLPGESGIKLRYSEPMLLDAVAADFPGLDMILDSSIPWVDVAVSIATHDATVYIDLSVLVAQVFPPQLVRSAGSFPKKRCCGSDFPLLTPDRWTSLNLILRTAWWKP